MVSSTSPDVGVPPWEDEPPIPHVDHGVNHGNLEQFQKFCFRYIRIGDPARPFRLEPFQLKILADYFEGVEETLILLPKGNGKSTLLAALALYHLYIIPDGDVKIVAANRPSAEQIFKFAQAMIVGAAAHPALKKLFKPKASTREIVRRDGLGEMKALPAIVESIDGKAPTLVLADELHHWGTSGHEVYAMLAGGLFKRGGRIVGISTAGADLESFLGKMRAGALEHIVEQKGAYRYCRNPDGQFVMHEWCLPKGARHDDFEAVKGCNPLSTISKETLARKFRSPSTIAMTWCRLHCNMWVQDAGSVIDAEEWERNRRQDCEIPDGAEAVIIGLDFGWREDSTAIIPVGVLSLRPLMVRVDKRLRIIKAPGDGSSTKVADIEAILDEFHERWPKAIWVLDPNVEGRLMAEHLEDTLGATVVIQHQRPEPMSHATSITSELCRGVRLEHPGNAEFTRQVVNAPGKYYSGAVRFDKHPTIPNDAAIALAMPCRQAQVIHEEAPAPPPRPVIY